MWLILYWGALLWAYADERERMVLGAGFVALALVAPLVAWITQENIRQRSPLFVAAIDLDERREDASAEDGLRQAAAVFPEDADVWFLLGIYAERAGDLERAQAEYGRADRRRTRATIRPILNRGNVHFTEGDYGEAIRDYTEASKRAPTPRTSYYNLSLARGEAYDFDGQAQAIAHARARSRPPRSPAGRTLPRSRASCRRASRSRARARGSSDWNAQPKSRRLPGHGTAAPALARPALAVVPWRRSGCCSLGDLPRAPARGGRGWPPMCERCGRAFCNRCRRYGDPALYCTMCSRLFLRKENVDIEVQVAEARPDAAARRRSRARGEPDRVAASARARTRFSRSGPSPARSRCSSSSSAWPPPSSTSGSSTR